MNASEFVCPNHYLLKRPGKRIFDIMFSLIALLGGLPIYLFLYLLVKCTSPGPGFYKGLRIGKNGKIIYCFKFRTMVDGASQKLSEILQKSPNLKEEWELFHKLKKDPRITRVGRILRKTSLDELPQFWNVLLGDLSIVGPRPLDVQNPFEAEKEIHVKYLGKAKKILSVRPGIISLWQLKGRNLLTLQQRIALEEEYIDTQSLLLDVKIICKTICMLLFPKGVY